QRAYLMLADESLVEPREATKASLRKLLLDMGQAPPGDVPVPTQLQALREAIEQRQTFGDHLIAVRRAQGFEAARDVFATGEGIALSARITSSMAPMALRAHDRLVERERHLAAVTTTTFLLLPIGSFLGLTALLAGLFFLDHGSGRRRQADESLARTQARLRVVFDSMAEGIRVVDAERNIVQMNRAGASLHGLIELVYTLDAMHAQVDGVLPDGRVLAFDEWPAMRALRGDFVHHCEMMFRRKDTGHTVFVELNTAPLPFEPGEPRQVVITSHDVSARKHAEADAREGRDRLEKVVENLTEGLMVHGLTGDFVHWNHAAQTLYELPRATATGMTIADFQQTFELFTLDGQGVPFGHWPMARLMRGELVQALELRVRRVGHDWERVFSYGGARVQAGSGAPLVFLTVTDVTARKAAELQLRQLTTELEQRVADRTRELVAKTRELETFCYSVSHDLKAPLRGIDGYSRLLSDAYGDKPDADGRQFIANVRAAAAQMNQLIEDLLAYSQLERRTLVPARIRLRALVEEQVARSALELGQARVSVEVADVLVLADRDGLAIALRNLIDNALKFSAYSQPPVIEIRSHQSGKHCVLSVKDNGTGFDMRYHGKIFEIFQRLQRAEDFPGTGIGLALVRKAMERMGGRVWAESQPGTGATFYLELESAEEHDTVDTTY
ncbi:MAG: PAS domain-containing protein, partial [Bacteriovorax sp.]|nr:PAS domain-containing protein [Rhizobacter sp.]